LIRIPYISSVPRENFSPTNQIRTRYRKWRTTSATLLQPSESLCYIGYTSIWWQHDCWITVQTLYACVSQPPGRGLVPGPGISYTGPRKVLLEFVVLVF